MQPVDLDLNATAPLHPAARHAIVAAIDDGFGNPSSVHASGQRARAAIEAARRQVAEALGVEPVEVVFTSGASESNALAWRGVCRPGGRAVTTTVEHPSLLAAARAVELAGTTVRRIGVDENGRLDGDGWQQAVAEPGVLLASAMAANNETGVRFDLAQLAAAVRRSHGRGVAVHCDLTQALGRVPIDVRAWDLDLASLSGHKLGAPTGVGVLFARRGRDLAALIGGHQELGRRGGTENVIGIVALGAVVAHLGECLGSMPRVRALRDELWTGLAARVPEVVRNGLVAAEEETGNTLSVAFRAVSAATLQRALDLEGVQVSTGAACASGTVEPSHVLLAMFGADEEGMARARATLRFSLGPTTTAAAIERALAVAPAVVARVRRFVPADS